MRSYPSATASKELIVIETDHDYGARGDEVWLTLLEQLLAHDVKQIAFTFMPEQVSERFYQRAVDSGQVVFGVQSVRSAKSFGKVLQRMPVKAADKKTVYGLIDSAPTQHGVSREQHVAVRANGLLFPSFEKQVERLQWSEKDQRLLYRLPKPRPNGQTVLTLTPWNFWISWRCLSRRRASIAIALMKTIPGFHPAGR